MFRNQRAPPNFVAQKAFIINVARRLVSPTTSDDAFGDQIIGRDKKRANGVGLVTFDEEAQVAFPLTSPFTEAEFTRFQQVVNAVKPSTQFILAFACNDGLLEKA